MPFCNLFFSSTVHSNHFPMLLNISLQPNLYTWNKGDFTSSGGLSYKERFVYLDPLRALKICQATQKRALGRGPATQVSEMPEMPPSLPGGLATRLPLSSPCLRFRRLSLSSGQFLHLRSAGHLGPVVERGTLEGRVFRYL